MTAYSRTGVERLKAVRLCPGSRDHLPDVDVEVEKGQLPHYDVDTAEVTVTTKEKEVKVPDVDIEVKTETKTIELPDIEVTMPDEKKENDEGGEGNN